MPDHAEHQVDIEVYAHAEDVAEALAAKVLTVLHDTVAADGVAHVSLTGGGAGINSLSAVASLIEETAVPVPPWDAVHFWWGDERFLPQGDRERNDVQAREALLDQLVEEHGLPEENIHAMPSSEDAESAQAGAQIYAQQLAQFAAQDGPAADLAMPQLCVMLLGVGPDGHINSLFPHRNSLSITGSSTTWETDAPADLGPPERITMTLDAVHTAERVWLGVTGTDKAEAVVASLAPGAQAVTAPASQARGARQTAWHVDRAAASQLTSEHTIHEH